MTEIVRLDAGQGAGRGGVDAGDMDTGLLGIRALGFNHEGYHYLSPTRQQIVQLAAAEHTEANLCQLRELAWWSDQFPGGRGTQRFDVAGARDALMGACHRVGVYVPGLVRGRGVWWDDERGAIAHTGHWVHSSGDEAWQPSEAPGPHVYEADEAWHLLGEAPLDDDEAIEVFRLCERLDWARGIDATLFAGWLVIAQVCGALAWRPHIGLTGPRESGKTFLVEQVMLPLLGPPALHVLGETTSAGLRQELGRDARAIVWDEAEPQGGSGQARVQGAIALARHLSTPTGGKVLKGGANHEPISFNGTGTMCLVSIFAQLLRDADGSRFTVLELQTRQGRIDAAKDAEIERLAARLTPAYSRGLFARTFHALPALRASHRTYALAIAERWKSRRLGDQLGALLAGKHLLSSTEPVTPKDAEEQVRELPDELRWTPAGVSDEERCLQRLASWWTRIDTAGGKRQVTRTVGELVGVALGGADVDLEPQGADRVLRRHGVRVDAKDQVVMVANHDDRLRDVYRDTDFDGGWARVLERLPDARKSPTSVYFGRAARSRATILPAAAFGEEEPPKTDPPPDAS